MNFHEKFVQLCKMNGVKPADVAKATGISQSSISVWKSRNSTPTDTNLSKIAEYFGMTVEQLKSDVFFDTFTVVTPPHGKKVPVLGTIACGVPILARENIVGYVDVNPEDDSDFALICRGDSMVPKLLDGDIVLIHRQTVVDNGKIAAVLIGDEATLKKVYYNGVNEIILTPENTTYPPMVYRGAELEQVRILGIAREIIRKLI